MVTLKAMVEDVEKQQIIAALEECDCVKARAARRLGITVRMIGYKIMKYGLKINRAGSVEASGSALSEHRGGKARAPLQMNKEQI